jgi:cell division protein FtsB
MEQRTDAIPSQLAPRISLRADKLARVFLVLCLMLCVWLAVAPARSFLQTRERAAEVSQQRQRLQQEQRLLRARSAELSRGNGLEEQARRQGLIESTERSYVIEDLPQP